MRLWSVHELEDVSDEEEDVEEENLKGESVETILKGKEGAGVEDGNRFPLATTICILSGLLWASARSRNAFSNFESLDMMKCV